MLLKVVEVVVRPVRHLTLHRWTVVVVAAQPSLMVVEAREVLLLKQLVQGREQLVLDLTAEQVQ